MADKIYVSKAKLELYDEKIKNKISADDAIVLSSAKSYTTSELEGFASEMEGVLGDLQEQMDTNDILVLNSSKSYTDSKEYITVDEIDSICGGIPEGFTPNTITYGITGLESGVSPLKSGSIYLVLEDM